ncbi:MAG TPA: hypothetical protein VJH87_06765, partial [Vicinamibacteria bacterium]|nr:hypothetical protein [Vicinamibacteria bacterium]
MRLTRLTAFLVVALAAVSGATQPEMEIAVPEPIPMGTTRGEKAGRLVLRNATVVSGRGSENG